MEDIHAKVVKGVEKWKTTLRKLGFGEQKFTLMSHLMIDYVVKKLVGIFCDVWVSVISFIFPTNFVIFDCEIDIEVSIFLA